MGGGCKSPETPLYFYILQENIKRTRKCSFCPRKCSFPYLQFGSFKNLSYLCKNNGGVFASVGCGSAKLERVEFSLTQSRLSIARINSALHSLLFRFGSAFLLRFTTQANKFERALHHPCTCKRNTANTGKTASTPTLSSPITLQLPHIDLPSPATRHPLLSILYNHI